MIRKFYSKIEKDKLLHIVYGPDKYPDWSRGNYIFREDISPNKMFLQSAFIYIPQAGHKFKAHIHKPLYRASLITQESWIVLRGLIRVTFYDLDSTYLDETVLYPTWMSITFYGGHGYECLEDNTEVLEYKLGPYFGVESDKENIKEEVREPIN